MSNPSHPPTTPGRPRLYGRAKGKPLRSIQQGLMDTLYPQIEIKEQPLSGLSAYSKIWLEIGFGGSEHLIWQARHNPDVAVLGAEPFLNGTAKAVAGVDEHALSNVRLYQGDGRDIMDKLPDGSLECIFVLFPDPWPKARHNKRRIITPEFLREVRRLLRPGGRFRFASDIIDYVDWTLTRLHADGGFTWPAKQNAEWRNRPSDWPQTRYEAKAIREGRPCHYFEFIKT